MASWASVIALSGFNYSAIEKSMSFTSKPGTYFWSNGTAWGTCTVSGKSAELKVLSGEISLNQFTLKGIDTKKFGEVKVHQGQPFIIDL
jgi:hypothetical protein